MPRFIDFIRRKDPFLPYSFEFDGKPIRGINWEWLYPAPFRTQLVKDAPTFVIDNIAQYVFGTEDLQPYQRSWQVRDLPNCAPPFDNFFMEWTQPYESWRQKSKFVGLHFYVDHEREIPLSPESRAYADCKWQLHCDLYLWSPGKETGMGPIVHWFLPIDEAGQMQETIMHHDKRLDSSVLDILKATLIPGLVTMAFMNWPKITVERTPPQKKFEKRYAQRHGTPLVRYYTLKFEPLRQLLNVQGGKNEVGIMRALHLCRGHWAEYGPEYGKGLLFGKFAGKFHIDGHWKGAKQLGAIHKDYEIVQPKIDNTRVGKRHKRILDTLTEWAGGEAFMGETVGLPEDEKEKIA